MRNLDYYVYYVLNNYLQKFERDIVNNYITISTHYIADDSFFDNDCIGSKNELMRVLTTGLENKLYYNIIKEVEENLKDDGLYYAFRLLGDETLPAYQEDRLKNLSINKCNEIGEKIYDAFFSLEKDEAKIYLDMLIDRAEGR